MVMAYTQSGHGGNPVAPSLTNADTLPQINFSYHTGIMVVWIYLPIFRNVHNVDLCATLVNVALIAYWVVIEGLSYWRIWTNLMLQIIMKDKTFVVAQLSSPNFSVIAP